MVGLVVRIVVDVVLVAILVGEELWVLSVGADSASRVRDDGGELGVG